MAKEDIMSALVPIENLNAVELFKPEGLTPILDKIEEEVNKHVPDTSTEEGRKAIKSLAFKVARSKTTMDDLGKALVQAEKEKLKVIDGERKRMRDRLDALKVEVLIPYDEWEREEKERIQNLEEKVRGIIELGEFFSKEGDPYDLENLRERLALLKDMEITKEIFQEKEDEARLALHASIKTIEERIPQREQYEADQAELVKLRKEQEEREAKERAEAEERRKREERERIEKAAKERAEKEAQARIEEEKIKAQQEAEAKIQAERDRVAKEKAEREAEEKRKSEEAERIRQAEEKRKSDEDNQRKTRAAIMLHFWSHFPEYALRPKKEKLEKYVDALTKGECPQLEVKY